MDSPNAKANTMTGTQASTIGPQALEEVAALLPGGVALVDAPVMGSADRAASGQLVVLAAVADALGLPTELVTGALANGPLAGLAGRAFAQGANYPLRLAAKDVTLATASANLPLLRSVHDWLIAFPEAGSEDLGQIVRHIRAQRQA